MCCNCQQTVGPKILKFVVAPFHLLYYEDLVAVAGVTRSFAYF